jgi:biofilm PGA synthesis N-glycosyltransferase PgaC
MITWKYIFWISCFVIFYNYAGYAILVYILNLFKSKRLAFGPGDFSPSVSFVVAAFNEEDCIEEKIRNSLELDYPADRIEFIFITDGSTDRTGEIISEYPAIRALHKPERKGKSAALNRAVSEAKGEILIFSDANTLLNSNAVKNLVRHYRDKKVGGVAGEKKVLSPEVASNESGDSEGLYWKYESVLKQLDSDFYSVVGAAGELVSFRKDLYEPIPHSIILDDFVI